MTQSTEIVAAGTATSGPSKTKRLVQMAGAAVISAGLVGTFALPAYAEVQVEGAPDGLVAAQNGVEAAGPQTLTAPTVEADAEVTALTANTGSNSSDDAQQAKDDAAEAQAEKDAERERQAALADQQNEEAADEAAPAEEAEQGEDIPSGKGAGAIVAAAKAQLGVSQDCTALVEKSLRAAGIPAGDLGTQVGEYTALGGKEITNGAYAPGDVLVWPGQHVAIYIGNGQAVHGGWNGGTTAIGPVNTFAGAPSAAVRF